LPTLEQVAEEVTKNGGHGIPIYCDHSKPDQVAKLFERISNEQNGRLDILVNNAFAAVTVDFQCQFLTFLQKMLSIMHTKFFDLPETIYDTVMDVGLKGH
jgi:dehydrogenase/reductase SDR family protein 1